jgi:dienelactone hydrolase
VPAVQASLSSRGVTHRNVEALLGRLITDPVLRRRFGQNPAGILKELREQGYELTGVEVDALAATDADAIRSFANALDRRICRAEVSCDLNSSRESRRRTMGYEPFARGIHPAGVRTIELRDASLSDRPVAAELWYPAGAAYRGKDLDEGTWDRYVPARGMPQMSQHAVRDAEAACGAFPLFLYCHGAYGHRRELSRLCTHLASHGYIVASANFPGDNTEDLIPDEHGAAAMAKTPVDESARNRPRQASRVLDLISAIELPADLQLDRELIGIGGESMGGFTSLAMNSVDRRPSAVFAICPMYGRRSIAPQARRLQPLLRVDNWQRRVPTFVLTGDLDPLVNVEDIRSLYHQMAAPKQLVVLRRAGHMHFADNAGYVHEWFRKAYLSGEFPDPELDAIALGTAMRPFAELCPEEHANLTARSLCLAHLDANLKDMADARAFLDGDLESTFAARGIAIEAARSALGAAARI